jgi:hypothetical protein
VPAALGEIAAFIDEGMDALGTMVFARFLEERHAIERSEKRHGVNIIEHYTALFDELWKHEDARMAMVPPKELLSVVNRKLQSVGAKAISFRALSSRLRADEIPAEMRDLLFEVEGLLG